jgi:hypothetical protein
LLADLEPGREIPDARLRVPADQRLEDIAVSVDEVRPAAPSGTDGEVDLDRVHGDRPALPIALKLPVEDTAGLALDQELKAFFFERITGGLVIAFDRRRLGHGNKRTSHRVSAISLGHVAVAFGTSAIPHVMDFRTDVAVRRWEG